MIPVYCITLDLQGKRAQRTIEEFRQCGVTPAMVRGINAAKWGLKTSIELHHNEGKPYFIDPGGVGCTLSHWSLWNHLFLSKVHEAMIVEDDVKLCYGFQQEFDKSYAELPGDWQLAFVGHCCAGDKPSTQVTPRIWDVRWPMCTHCYLVKHSALEVLLDHAAQVRTKLDAMLVEDVFEKSLLKAYTFQPRQAEQYGTFLAF